MLVMLLAGVMILSLGLNMNPSCHRYSYDAPLRCVPNGFIITGIVLFCVAGLLSGVTCCACFATGRISKGHVVLAAPAYPVMPSQQQYHSLQHSQQQYLPQQYRHLLQQQNLQ